MRQPATTVLTNPLCDNQTIVLTARRLSLLVLAACLTHLGCRAQTPAPGEAVTPELSRRIEVLLRQKANLPPGSTISVTPRTPSEFAGYDNVSVTFTVDGNTSHPIAFLVSKDGKTLAKMDKFDISADPRNLVSAADRPSRGGPATAPVVIVGFDDLECPYCARLHAAIFPAITARYGDKVHIVYKDFPLPADMHPWAMHAAVDVNCIAAQSEDGYWNLVDYIHAHAGEIGKPPATEAADTPADKTLALANSQLDKFTRSQGEFQKVDLPKLDACIAKQDTTAIKASTKIGEDLHVDSTPSLFINGDKIDGAVPIAFIFGVIDNALLAEGVQPPPPYVAPAPATPPAAPAATPAPKPTSK